MTMQQAKMAGLACLIAVTVLGAGYLWGARGRWAAQDRLAAVERQAALSETRRLTLAGQMALTRLNFGEAAGLFESARAGADAAAKGLEHEGLPELAGTDGQRCPGVDRGSRPGGQARSGLGRARPAMPSRCSTGLPRALAGAGR